MQYFHFVENHGRSQREVAFSAKTASELEWVLNDLGVNRDTFDKAMKLFGAEGGVFNKSEGKLVTIDVIGRDKYDLVKARRLQSASFRG